MIIFARTRVLFPASINNFRNIGFVISTFYNRLTSQVTNDKDMAETKRQCTKKIIGTHNGSFHCDEALACFLLRRLPEYKDAEIVRTRDPKKLEGCDIVVDVGGVFDPTIHRYDHHQRSFSHSMNSLEPSKSWTTKLSSAGLVYLYFGRRVLRTSKGLTDADEQKVEALFDKVYENFMEEIDAIDNGISQTDENPRYQITSNLSSRVKHLNPDWMDKNPDEEAGFQKAMQLTGEEFLDKVNYYTNSWWPARELVETALKERSQVDKSGEIVVFKEGGCPWKEHLFSLEKSLSIETPIKYVLYSDSNGKWRVQCVAVSSNSFSNRLSLPEKWRGIRNEELSELSGIPGCIFVHANGFIGGNETYEGALQMARTSLAQAS
ncbi:MYG1 exonuclease-like [Asterias amurensis]|uniref:MYG1 exonuclease-like n=1 Tax=Asterias amurensis TaxID=7602 RepID=UPI003AB7FE57